MQREILNVAKACQLPGFRYVRFEPVAIVARLPAVEHSPEPMVEAEVKTIDAPALHVIPDLVLAPAAVEVQPEPPAPEPPAPEPPAPEPLAPEPAPAAPIDHPIAARPSRAPTPTPIEPAPRQFALLVEMNQSIAARGPARPGGRGARAELAAPSPPTINRSIRTARAPATASGAESAPPDSGAAEPMLLAEVNAAMQRRAAVPIASSTAHRPRPSRTP